MAKDKDRALNPATAQLKADKARALKKGKAAITAQRTERLAQRNPARLERQIADLKASGGDAGGARDKKQLEELEKQLGMVRKAREKVGDKGPRFGGGVGGGERGRGGGERGRGRGGGGGGGGGILGKRARGQEERGGSSGSETDESVRRIPMPRDTPPPLPSSYRDRGGGGRGRGRGRGGGRFMGAGDIDDHNANLEPLGPGRERHTLPPKPEMVVPKTTYEAKPVVRDLRKEAVKAFMPAVVARKVRAVRGEGGRLLEEEEVERLEREGYLGGGGKRADGGGEEGVVDAAPGVGERMGDDDVEKRRLEEEERFGREVRMEEVRDEDL